MGLIKFTQKNCSLIKHIPNSEAPVLDLNLPKIDQINSTKINDKQDSLDFYVPILDAGVPHATLYDVCL